eukprot:gene19332-biopygen14543
MRKGISSPLPLGTGVPQGSVLGPLLFSISVCDIQENFEGIEIVQYADDCTLIIPITEGEDPSIATQCKVQRFVDYCAANRIAAEPEKTQLLHIESKRRMAPRAVFSKLETKLPGRWWASSKQLEVPRLTVGDDLIARFDDDTEYTISQGENDTCKMDEWTVSSVKGRHIYWQNNERDAQVRWTRYVNQPTKEDTAADEESEEALTSEESDQDSDQESEDTGWLVAWLAGHRRGARLALLGALACPARALPRARPRCGRSGRFVAAARPPAVPPPLFFGPRRAGRGRSRRRVAVRRCGAGGGGCRATCLASAAHY